MKQIIPFIIVSFLIAFTGCSKTASNSTVEINESKFSVKTDLNGKAIQLPEIASFGITEIKVLDSLMVISTMENENFWHFYALPQMDSIGSYFNIGNGPYEFIMPVPCFQTSYYKNGQNDNIAYIPLLNKQKILGVNLTNLLKDGNYETNATLLDTKPEQMPLWVYGLNPSIYLQAVVDPETKSIKRSLRTFSDQASINLNNEYLELLNSGNVDSMEDLQLLLTSPTIGRNGDIVAEIPGYDNRIVVYETNGTGGAVIYYTDVPSDKSELAQLARKNLSVFGGGYGYEDFFTLIRNEIKNDEITNQHLDFISWDGTPLGSINTGMNNIRRFDIDQTIGTLYCLDGDDDTIKGYDIKDFLREIQTSE